MCTSIFLFLCIIFVIMVGGPKLIWCAFKHLVIAPTFGFFTGLALWLLNSIVFQGYGVFSFKGFLAWQAICHGIAQYLVHTRTKRLTRRQVHPLASEDFS